MKLLAVLSVLGMLATASSAALQRPYYVVLGMSSTALLVASATAVYVYVKVARAAKQETRVAAAEATADKLDAGLG